MPLKNLGIPRENPFEGLLIAAPRVWQTVQQGFSNQIYRLDSDLSRRQPLSSYQA
jgi:hypothetical protein